MILEEAKRQMHQHRQLRVEEEQKKIDESYKREPTTDFKDVEVIPGSYELEPLTDEQL